jgi:hypothetical protein
MRDPGGDGASDESPLELVLEPENSSEADTKIQHIQQWY